jgi:hypothetical protein
VKRARLALLAHRPRPRQTARRAGPCCVHLALPAGWPVGLSGRSRQGPARGRQGPSRRGRLEGQFGGGRYRARW